MSAGSDAPRRVPFYCPFCGDEDLEPVDDGTPATRGGWRCGACTTTFVVRTLRLPTGPDAAGAIGHSAPRTHPHVGTDPATSVLATTPEVSGRHR
jgi:hypothetical protein